MRKMSPAVQFCADLRFLLLPGNVSACILAVLGAGIIALAGTKAAAERPCRELRLPAEAPVALKKKKPVEADYLPSGLFFYF
jgi:hypothetical protein